MSKFVLAILLLASCGPSGGLDDEVFFKPNMKCQIINGTTCITDDGEEIDLEETEEAE